MKLSKLFVIALCLMTLNAYAHSIRLFATTDGKSVSGYVYVSGGKRLADVDVVASGVGEDITMKTDEDGAFEFTPPKPGTYHLSTKTADGHAASFSIAFQQDAPEQDTSDAPAPSNVDVPGLEQMIERATAHAIRPLEEQIDALQHHIQLRDAIGGIGYIMGVLAIVFWLKGRRA